MRRLTRLTRGLPLFVLVAIYYLAYQSLDGFDLWDFGYVMEVSRRVVAGEVLYRDIRLYTYLPGVFFACALVQAVCPAPVTAVWGLCYLGLAARLPFLRAILRRYTGPGVAAATLLVALVVHGSLDKFYVCLLGVWILSAALAWLERPVPRRALGYGFAWGVAMTVRLDQGLIATGLLGVLVVAFSLREPRHRPGLRQLGAVLGGGLLGAAPVHLMLLAQGVWTAHLGQWIAVLPVADKRFSEAARLAPPPLADVLRLDRAGVIAGGYYLGLAVVVALGMVAVYEVVRVLREDSPSGKARLRAGRWLLAGAWAVPALLPWAFERPDVFHLTQYGSFVYVPAALVAARTGRPGKFLLGVVAAVFLYCHASMYITSITDHRRWSPAPVKLVDGRSYGLLDFEAAVPLIDHILTHSDPDDRVEVLPYRPGINYLARRRSMGRELYLAPHSLTSPEVLEDYLEALREDPPRFVVYYPKLTFNWRESGRLGSFAPEVVADLEASYREVMAQGPWRLLEPKDLNSQR